jgi:hypothetical protein
MTELKTPPAFLKALRKSATRELTPKELHNQRVSFIMGSVKESSGITRAQVERVLAPQAERKKA